MGRSIDELSRHTLALLANDGCDDEQFMLSFVYGVFEKTKLVS